MYTARFASHTQLVLHRIHNRLTIRPFISCSVNYETILTSDQSSGVTSDSLSNVCQVDE